jgi:hypothetical protein
MDAFSKQGSGDTRLLWLLAKKKKKIISTHKKSLDFLFLNKFISTVQLKKNNSRVRAKKL